MIPLNVLFVEDDPADRLAFERFVEEHGLPITYLLAGSLNEAKGLVTQGGFDLIVTDYSLGDGTAIDLLPFAHGVPVILIAGTRDEEIAARAFTAGISDSLVKDVGRHYLEQLPERMEKAVGQRLRPVQKLQEDQELYRRVVDTANEGIWIADPDYITSFVNRRMAEMLGYQPVEMVGQPIQQFLFPEDLADFADRTHAQGGTALAQYERRFRHKDGSVRWTIISTTTTLNEQGELRGSFAMVTDITKRKKAEEALKESEEKYRALVENANEAIVVTQDMALKFANPKVGKLLGYSLQEVVGRPFVDLIHPDDRLQMVERYRKRLDGEVPAEVVPFRTIHKDGSIRWAEINSVRIAWEGNPAIMSFLNDITDRKRTEEALRESEQRITSIYNTVGDVIFQLAVKEDGHYRFVSVNRAFLATTGLTSPQVIGKRVDEVIPEPSLTLVLEKYREAIQEKRIVRWEETSEYPTGKLIGEVSVAPVFDSSGNCTHLVGAVHDITERKRAEEALRESEAKYRLLADNTVDGVWLLDMNLKLIYCSPSSEKQSGFTLQEIMEMSLEQYFTPESLNVVAEAFLEEMPKVEADPDYNPILTLDLEFYKKDGTAFWAESKFSIVRDEHGKPVSILGQARDITERKQLEKALRQSEAKYRSLVETAIEGVASIDTNGNLTFINDALCRMMQYSQDELLNKPFAGILHPDDLPALMEAFLSEVAGTRTVASIEFRGIPKTGQSIWFSTQPMAITIDGKVIGFNAILHDITESKRAEEALVQVAREWQTTFDATNDMIWLLDKEQRVLRANKTSEQLFQHPCGELVGMHCWEIVHGRSEPIPECPILRARKSLSRETMELQIGNGWFVVTVDPILDATGEYVGTVHMVSDITERKQVEEALRESKSSLQTILRSTADGLLAVDRENRMLLANERFGEMWKIPREVIICRDDAVLLQYILDQLIDPQGYLQKVRQLDGSEEDSYDTLNFKDGRIFERLSRPLMLGIELRGRVWSFRDITERKRAEEALRESEERFRSLYENSTIGLYRTTPDGRILLANPALVSMLGYSSFDDLSIRNLKKNGFEQSYPRAQFVEMIEKDGEVKGLESAWMRKDGTIFFVRESASAIRDSQARTLYYDGTVEDITARKRAEEALRESKERLELALIGGDLGFYDWDLQTGRVYTDERYLAMLGYAPGEVDLGSRANWEQQVHPDDLSFANYPVQSDLWGETLTYDEEYRMRHKSGEWVWVRDRSQITARAADGRPLRVTGIHENINERKRVEEALYFSNQRLELAQRSAGAGIWDWDMTRQHLDWSRELYLLFGLDPDETEATFDIWHQVLHPDDREIASHRIDQAIADRIPLISEYRVIHLDGQVRWIRALGNTIYDQSGQPLRMAGICIDITERKQAEEKLRKSEALLEEVGEMARVGGWQLDVETRQVFWTSETYRIHEIPEGERYDLANALLFYDLPGRSTLETALQLCMETGEGFDLELPFTSAKGRHLWTRAMGRAVKADGKVIRLMGTFQDISERKQLEERIRQVRNDMLFAVSHDMKTPLQALNQSQEMLSTLEPEEALARFQEYRQIWRRNLQRLERMINNLVDSQRGEEDRFPLLLAPCRPTEIVQRVMEDLQGYAQVNQVSLDLKLGLEPVPEGSCDEEAFGRVVENLLTNAVKFSPKGGKVEVRLWMGGKTLLLEVEDHGAGISPEEQAQLFQPFQRGRSAQQKGIPGTGLGLYVCRRIMEAHGGSISLTSQEGQGTTVTVTLPLQQ